MQFGYRAKALTLSELRAIVDPQQANQPEVVPAVLYSTAAYPAAGTNGLVFFNRTTVDPTRENVNNGQLPAPQFFREWQWFADFLGIISQTADQTGRLNDAALILNVARGVLRHTISSKQQFGNVGVPLRTAGAIGGAAGNLSSTVAAVSQQLGRNGLPGWSPFHVNGMIVIPPQTDFDAQIQFQAALVPITADLDISVECYGELYRRVL